MINSVNTFMPSIPNKLQLQALETKMRCRFLQHIILVSNAFFHINYVYVQSNGNDLEVSYNE